MIYGLIIQDKIHAKLPAKILLSNCASQMVAVKYNGNVRVSQFRFYPVLKIYIKSQEIIFSFNPRRKNYPATTIAKTYLLGNTCSTYVRRKGLVHFFETLSFGVKKIECGEDEFDKKFVVKTDNKQITKRIMDPSIQQKLLAHIGWNIFIKVKSNNFSIKFECFPNSEDDLEQMISVISVLLEKFG